MNSGDKRSFVSGQPLTRGEKAAYRESAERDRALVIACQQMGIPLRPLSPEVRRLLARMRGERDEA